ncbi:MAG TPA: rhomboid family intramembrane serine protease [Planktothrix sp.]|jgi:rhomboid protease GluP
MTDPKLFDEMRSRAPSEDVIHTRFEGESRLNLALLLHLVVTLLVIFALTDGLFSLSGHLPHSTRVALYAQSLMHCLDMTPKFIRGQFWRPITYLFIHGNLLHLVGNLIGLIFAFRLTVDLFAKRGWLWIFLITGSVTAIIYSPLHAQRELMGASAAVMGLIGAAIAGQLRSTQLSHEEKPAHRWVNVPVLLVLIAYVFLSQRHMTDVAQGAHAMGVVLGFLMGMLMPMNAGEFIWCSRSGITVSSEGPARWGKLLNCWHRSVTTVLLPEFEKKSDFLILERRQISWNHNRRGFMYVLEGPRSPSFDRKRAFCIASHRDLEGVETDKRHWIVQLAMPQHETLPSAYKEVLRLVFSAYALFLFHKRQYMFYAAALNFPGIKLLPHAWTEPSSLAVAFLINMLLAGFTGCLYFWVSTAVLRKLHERREATDAIIHLV